MITKERLEELIKQGATIYWLYGKSIEKKVLKHKYHKFFIDTELNEYNEKLGIGIWKHKLSKLFETKEEAEWHLEFGNITRTETLKLPTWEENKSVDCIFTTPNRSSYYLKSRVKTGYSIERENPYIIRIGKFGESDNFIDFEFTKENYILACRKCKEIFLKGE